MKDKPKTENVTETWRCVNFEKNCVHLMVGQPRDSRDQVACVCGHWYECKEKKNG